jgi:hypothetical protein
MAVRKAACAGESNGRAGRGTGKRARMTDVTVNELDIRV